jgi:hypothetical protein
MQALDAQIPADQRVGLSVGHRSWPVPGSRVPAPTMTPPDRAMAPASIHSGRVGLRGCPAPFVADQEVPGRLRIAPSCAGSAATLAYSPHSGQATPAPSNEKQQPQKHATSAIIHTFFPRCSAARLPNDGIGTCALSRKERAGIGLIHRWERHCAVAGDNAVGASLLRR